MGGAQACLGCRVQSRRAIIRNAHRAKVCQHDLDQFLMEYASEFELDCYGDVFHRSDLSLIPEASKGNLPTFSCEGIESDAFCYPRAGGLVARGVLTSLLRGSDVCVDNTFHSSCVELCGCMFVTPTVFSQNARPPFLLLRQTINRIVECVEDGGGSDQIKVLCQQCVTFLSFLECYVYRYLTVEAGHANRKQIALNIVTQLSPLCQHLGPLEDQLSMLRRCGGSEPIAHLVLHIHWTSLAILHRLTYLLGPGRFVECAYTFIISCLCECASVFNKTAYSSAPSLFPCPCTIDLWLLVEHCLDNNNKSLWDLLFDILLSLLQPSEHAPPLAVNDPVLFAWWTLSQLARLSAYSDDGRLTSVTTPTSSNWSFVLEHLTPVTFGLTVSEINLCLSLECAVSMVARWGPSCQLVSKAWEFFHKHMNDPMSTNVRGGLGWAPSRESYTPKQWLEHALKLCSHSDHDRATSTDYSSYELFLCLLSHVLSHRDDEGVGGIWKQLRGRLYSRIHRRWMSELSVLGVGRVVTLFLVLAASADTREVSDKMLANLSFLSLSSPQDRLTPLLWRGLFALLLLHERLNLSMASLVGKLLTPISDLVGHLRSPDSRCAWDALSVVLDGSLEVIESTNGIALGACDVIGSHLSKLLGVLDGSRLTKLLHVIESLGTALATHHSLPSSCCHSYLEHCILPLPSHTLAPPLTLHSTSASGTLLALQWAGTLGQSSYASQLMADFGLRESTHPFVASGYLCHVISNTVMCQELVSTEHAQLAVLHTWIRCIVLSHAHALSCDDHVTELTRLLPNLRLVSSLLIEENYTSDPLTLLKLLLTAMTRQHTVAGVSGVWRERVGSMLGDLVRMMEPVLAGRAGIEALRSCYSLSSLVMTTCPELIYSRINSRCLLPQLVDRLVLPIATGKNPSTHGQTACIKANLHHFISGLLQLSPDKDDFIKRKLRQIFSRYFLSYCQPAGPFTSHSSNPFMLLMSPWFEERALPQKAQQLTFILDTITSQFLQLPQQPASLLPTLQFLRDFVQRLKCNHKSVCLSLLPSLLPCLLACDVCQPINEPRGIRKHVMVMFRVLFGSRDSAHISSLVPIVDHFVSSNLGQPRGASVFKTLMSVLPLHPPLTTPTLSLALRAVESVETGRGVGVDSTLREGYRNLQATVCRQTD